jgi:hypothetical protein
MKTLHLTLTRKWFLMILSGEKQEEYRTIKEHWCRIFYECLNVATPRRTQCRIFIPAYDRENNGRCDLCSISQVHKYDIIEFRNGYSKDAPTMLVECKDIMTGVGRPEWGAPTEPVFILKLGAVLETRNCEKL